MNPIRPHSDRHFTLMKAPILLATLALALSLPLKAQVFKNENTQKVVNTLRERIKLSGYVQGAYTADRDENTFELKRAILMADGQITKQWRVYYMLDLKGPKTLEAYTEYKFHEALQVRFGQYKNPFSIENQISPTLIEQIETYSLVGNYLAGISSADPLYGGHSGRDQGLMVFGNLVDKGAYHALTYKLAVMNGQGINVKDKNTQKDLIAYLHYKPCAEATLAASIWEGRGHAIAESPYNPGLKTGDNYRRARWSAGAEVKTRLADLRGEYMAGRDAGVRSQGYYVVGNLHLTDKLDLLASYDYLQRNKDMGNAAEQTNYIGGLQYWFYPRCRLQLVYTYRDNLHDPNQRGGNLLQAQVQVRF